LLEKEQKAKGRSYALETFRMRTFAGRLHSVDHPLKRCHLGHLFGTFLRYRSIPSAPAPSMPSAHGGFSPENKNIEMC